MPTRQHPELGQVHCARMENDSAQRVAASQAGSHRKGQLQAAKDRQGHRKDQVLRADYCFSSGENNGSP